MAPEADAFTVSEIAEYQGVEVTTEDPSSAMDERQVTTGSRILFITPTLKGVLDEFGSKCHLQTYEQMRAEHIVESKT